MQRVFGGVGGLAGEIASAFLEAGDGAAEVIDSAGCAEARGVREAEEGPRQCGVQAQDALRLLDPAVTVGH